jgi:hypothetical protein
LYILEIINNEKSPLAPLFKGGNEVENPHSPLFKGGEDV